MASCGRSRRCSAPILSGARPCLRFTRERMELHRHPEALADALRAMPHTQPFDGVAELESLDIPALVVASHDDADPAHPYAVAEAWAQSIPGATFVSEEPGEAPLAWQGGKLAREIAEFCERLGESLTVSFASWLTITDTRFTTRRSRGAFRSSPRTGFRWGRSTRSWTTTGSTSSTGS